MQDRNHYDTLGLATTGVNPDTGKPYSDAEIRRAHKELSRDTHTDKTKLADARERFEKIQESYRLLIDPEQRAKFDKLLKDDPGLSSKPVHLFVRVDVEFNETADEKEDKTAEVKLSSSTELVVYKPKGIPKGINLTELLLNANYSAEQLLAQAKLNPGFATAILQAVSLWRLFSTEQQLEFFIYFYSSQKREAKADLTSIKINKPIHSLLLALENNDTVQKYFVTLVGKKEHAKIALDFLVDAKSYILSFNKYTLLSLALSFEIIIPYLLEKYNAELSVAELYALIMEHPAQKEKILSALSQERKSLMDDYLEADRAICERGISCTKYFAHHARALKNLGVEALKLVSISLEDFTIEKVIEKNKLGFLIINNLANKIEKGQLTPDEFNACAETITKRFLFYNYRLIVEDPSKLFEQEILRTLLEKFTDQYFIFLINNFKFEHWSYSSQLFLCRYFLTFRYEDSLVFLDRLQRHDHNVFQVLKNNPPLLSQFFATKEYTDALKGNPSLLKIFIKDVASPENTKQLTDLLIREKLCEPTVNKQLHAISKLHQYIQPEPSEEKTKKVSAREINYSKFAELYKESGFFPDLMRLNTKNSQVMMTLLRDGTHSPHMENDKFKSALETKLEFVLQNELPDEKAHAALFDTLSTSQLDNSVIKLLNESKEGPWKTVRFLSLNDRIRNKFITGRQLDALLAKESGQWLPVKYERLPEFSFKFASCRDKLQRIQFLKHLKESDFPYEQYATQDTTTHFSALVQLARSSWFVPMLMAYYELLELLDNIRHINSTELNNEETLTSLISVINKSGLDHATLSDIIRRYKISSFITSSPILFDRCRYIKKQ